ncbi:MAG: aminomethyl-transferring glycine dehydrogenase [Phycisphaerales bacterium]|nr:aminomethyl-transferring glycine dehydrogenase [Phycisphaerales bacterium]
MTATMHPESITEEGSAMCVTECSPFVRRHVGPSPEGIASMLDAVGCADLSALTASAMPESIRTKSPLHVGPGDPEHVAVSRLRSRARANTVLRSAIGMGYHDTIVPPVIQRNILENPCWYTQYTPYQAEISQGRLEALLNFQTMVSDLTALPIANASLLDEATAVAEAMQMARGITRQARSVFMVDRHVHPQTLAVLRGRCAPLGVELKCVDVAEWDEGFEDVFGVLVQTPCTNGRLRDWTARVQEIRDAGAVPIASVDLLSLCLVTPPGEMGFEIAVGSAQRFGVPMGYGGPHAAFIATEERHVRRLPGRIIGVSKDATGAPALRMAIQTREQHIKRDRATSNICTAQVLLAIMSGMYACWHGPEGLRAIARGVHQRTLRLRAAAVAGGLDVAPGEVFDTLRIECSGQVDTIMDRARTAGWNLRRHQDADAVGIALDETTTDDDLVVLLEVLGVEATHETLAAIEPASLSASLERTSDYLTHEVFRVHRSETEMLRYITSLQERDLSLANSMIPLGSCTMKLNAVSEMVGVSWPGFSQMHPFAPLDQAPGYRALFEDLESWLADLTGFDRVSLQPNAGSQGEYAGLMVIRALHAANGEEDRDVCLIPVSAHGTNPASAIAAGFRVVTVACDDGDICLDDLRAKLKAHEGRIGALMLTYPSTHGVFEDSVRTICDLVHEAGGQVYLDGANFNAMVGLARPGELGADVCHLNLHKTFCIPHGGGGPGMGPIAVASHLAPFLPSHPVVTPTSAGAQAIEPVSAAPWGSPSILVIPWVYIAAMGAPGLQRASEVAILGANYMKRRLEGHYDIVFLNENGFCAHEFILDLRAFDKSAGVKPDDVAKRLMDFGFHAPTMSWPVPGTLMIEPTESETKAEMDRYCDALIAIREEIRDIEEGRADRDDNVLKHAPHPVGVVTADEWDRPYSRTQAAWPAPWLRTRKFWPPVARIDNPHGDRNLMCTCPPPEAWSES